MRIDQPFRRRGRWRAHHHLQTRITQHAIGAVEPAEIIAAGVGLDPAPGEFADPYIAQPEPMHPRGIPGPPILRPVFGIIADTEHSGFLKSPCQTARFVERAKDHRFGRAMDSLKRIII
jgi:hypothetical protein